MVDHPAACCACRAPAIFETLAVIPARASADQALTAAITAELMRNLYRTMINDQAGQFAELFERLPQADVPAGMHCTAGRHRTGIAAALLLWALIMLREEVLQGWPLTHRHYRHVQPPHSEAPVRLKRFDGTLVKPLKCSSAPRLGGLACQNGQLA